MKACVLRLRQQSNGLRQVLGWLSMCAALTCIVAALPAPSARASSADRAAGAELFKQKGCEHCHGVDGAGTERAPALLTVGKRMKKDEIRSQIVDGGKQMPAFRDVLSEEETRQLVDYLAHKKKAPKAMPGS